MRLHLFYAFLIVALIGGCSDRQRRNPLDPLVYPLGEDAIGHLESLAGDGEVRLRWDYSLFEDITGFYLYRRAAGKAFVRHPDFALSPDATEFIDVEVENGTTYEYRLSLLIEGEDERLLDEVEQATPGEEVAWVADRASGLIWKISADGRSARFAQGRFSSIVGMGLNREDGSVWVSDRFFAGVYRITADGELELHPADVGEAGSLGIDAEEGRGWLVDVERKEVRWFSLEADTLEFGTVDAHFTAPALLAPGDGGCWIGDGESGRLLFYEPEGIRLEFGELDRPAAIAAGQRGLAWVLVEGGDRLLRLTLSGERQEVELPFGGGVALDVDRQSGQCWIIGKADMAVVDPNGALLQHWRDLPGGRSIAVDEVHRRVWVATGEVLWKFTVAGESLSSLGGFSGVLRVVVDPE